VAVAQKRRQHWQTPLDVLIGSVPLNQGIDSKSMSKIVKPRALVSFRLAQACLPRQFIERAAHSGNFEAAAVIIEKEAGR